MAWGHPRETLGGIGGLMNGWILVRTGAQGEYRPRTMREKERVTRVWFPPRHRSTHHGPAVVAINSVDVAPASGLLPTPGGFASK